MKKILILANSSAGLYDFRNELLVKLLSDYQVIVSLPDEVKIKELEEEGIRVIHTDLNRRGVNPIEDLKLLISYKKLIKAQKPDLVLTYTIKPNIYGGFCCRMYKIPYITTVTGLGSTFQKKGPLLAMISFLYRMGLKNADCIFFQNDENMKIFEEYRITGKKSRLVKGSGVNLSKHQYESYPEEDAVRFLFIGRIMREKGIEELLAAAEAIVTEANGSDPDNQVKIKVEFELLGYCDENYQDKLDEYEKRGLIVQLGFHPEVHEYIKNASALVLPTYHEGMSNVLMEASAVGRPVIATNISGCREIFEEGVTGFGCEPESTSSLIMALKRFLELSVTERECMGTRARAKMEREFNRERIAEAYSEEVSSILNDE